MSTSMIRESVRCMRHDHLTYFLSIHKSKRRSFQADLHQRLPEISTKNHLIFGLPFLEMASFNSQFGNSIIPLCWLVQAQDYNNSLSSKRRRSGLSSLRWFASKTQNMVVNFWNTLRRYVSEYGKIVVLSGGLQKFLSLIS